MVITPFIQRLAYLLAADIALSFAYAWTPANLTPVRLGFAYVQLAIMAVTMWVAIRRVLEDY